MLKEHQHVVFRGEQELVKGIIPGGEGGGVWKFSVALSLLFTSSAVVMQHL